MMSHHALGLGDARWKLARLICGIFGLYLHPNRILLSKFYLRPPTRKYPHSLCSGDRPQTVGWLYYSFCEKIPKIVIALKNLYTESAE